MSHPSLNIVEAAAASAQAAVTPGQGTPDLTLSTIVVLYKGADGELVEETFVEALNFNATPDYLMVMLSNGERHLFHHSTVLKARQVPSRVARV